MINIHFDSKNLEYAEFMHYSKRFKTTICGIGRIWETCEDSFQLKAFYEGQIENGVPHGFGRKIQDDGTISVGYFINGQLQGKAIIIQNDSLLFEGIILVNHKLHTQKITSFAENYKFKEHELDIINSNSQQNLQIKSKRREIPTKEQKIWFDDTENDLNCKKCIGIGCVGRRQSVAFDYSIENNQKDQNCIIY